MDTVDTETLATPTLGLRAAGTTEPTSSDRRDSVDDGLLAVSVDARERDGTRRMISGRGVDPTVPLVGLRFGMEAG